MPRRNVYLRFFLTTLAPLAILCVSGCGGGLPLLHSAHVLPPGRVSAGAGLSGQVVLQDLPSAAGTDQSSLETQVQNSTIAPAIAPWVSARVGIAGSNEAGLSYTGRAIRLDARHSFKLNKKNSLALSAGLGGEVLLVGRPRTGSQDPQSLLGGGVDLPILFGWRSTAGLYSAWIGPRPGISFIQGAFADGTAFSARDGRLGFVGGLSLGFRQIHVAMELGGAFHFVNALVDETQRIEFTQFTLTPAGALVLTF
ncbi:MAG: hypothetical protein IPM54_10670 [Polyangiaceae bacterium]|nr:hypothetical protein [Polyangiaceae bacterium]